MEQTTNIADEAESSPLGNIDLIALFFAVYEKKWYIAAFALLATTATYFSVQNIPDRYQATATLLLAGNQANLVSIRDVYEAGGQRREFLMTQVEMLQSRGIAERVVDALNLENHPEFNRPPTPTFTTKLKRWIGLEDEKPQKDPVTELRRKRERIVNIIVNNIKVSPIRNTQLIKLSYESYSPQLAAGIPNAVANAYIAEQQSVRTDVTEKATSWLSERLEGLRDKLEASEHALNQFQQQEDLVDLQGVRGLASQELNETMNQLLEARREFKDVQVLYNQVRRKDVSEESLLSQPEVLNHPLIQTVRQAVTSAQLGVTELARRYGPKHPTMQAAQDELESARAQLRSEIRKLVASIEIDYRQARDKVRDLEAELSGAKSDLQTVAQKEIRYDELKREVEVNSQLYNTFLTRFKETREVAGFESAAARLADPAITPRRPLASKKRLLVLFAFVASAGLCVGIIVLLDLLKSGIRDPQDVSRKLGLPLMGMVPEVRSEGDEPLPLYSYFDGSQLQFAEAIRSLRTGVVLSRLDNKAEVICITSSAPAEGKTTISINLSFALGQLEKVLLIDADMRRPSLGRRFEIAASRPGLADLLSGRFSIDECIVPDKKSGIDLIPAGIRPEDPQRLLGSVEFQNILKELRGKYDRIIIDTPPVQAVSDVLVISKLACSLLYVVRAEETKIGVIRAGVSRLMNLGIKPEGVILNGMSLKRRGSGSEEYYGYYPEYIQ
ncbi:GumC family protein [Microbulbifer hydrolyticus]|uniref:non-specific protein-tyrosine kinase n=1 Tax=Microbulbifer hydrolyticus TaxID=48074 RepID=A0A6P1TCN8_9GAMM|nr:polysaccharide biosynthesis tyrosine autokinase [Microbulbifer hydrolyticus]MBB5211858.1 capsular exopolysaccharide synthesis family protein [Microbulbifer hydrolyticus]QHQ40554.1 polysaccharide biosynthesis tyrosine autokinase [Microbulbifer hydrolyticus]